MLRRSTYVHSGFSRIHYWTTERILLVGGVAAAALGAAVIVGVAGTIMARGHIRVERAITSDLQARLESLQKTASAEIKSARHRFDPDI